MENVGIITRKPSQNKDGKWNHLDIEYNSQDEFNEATSKMMNVLYKNNADGRCIISDTKGNKYVLDLVHSTYDTINNIIRVFPHDCRTIQEPEKKIVKKEIITKK